MNSKPTYQTNGSSVHTSRSSSPDVEPVAELPMQNPGRMFEPPEQRVPTPFPLLQQPIDQTIEDHIPVPAPSSSSSSALECELPPLPLAMPIARPSTSRPLSPFRLLLVPPLSPASSDDVPPVPLSPIVHVRYPFPHSLSVSSSAASFEAVSHLIRKLREDRRTYEDTRSRSVASGLYEFANMLMPRLPEYEAPIYDDLTQQEELEHRRRRDALRCFYWVCGAVVLVGSGLAGQQIGNLILKWQSR